MDSYTAFLRVRHPSIDPDEITRELGLEPAHAWAAGSPRAAEPARGAHPDSYWFAPLAVPAWAPESRLAEWPGSQTLPLESFLLAQVRLLTPHKSFFARINTEGGSCELAVTLGMQGRLVVELPASLVRSLAALDLSVTLEVATADELPN
ncbi:MAG TPA: DUF4279 domain-containing protein [Steroidobacteraceae bacterium]|nr:DUF4279 domain-containing protein [Steroidobacteraceae bacterium]